MIEISHPYSPKAGAIAPKEVPAEDIIANLESAIRTLPEEKGQEIRTETARILQKVKPPKNNLKPAELNQP